MERDAGSDSQRLGEVVMLGATALRETIQSRRISCVEVMNAYLDHIERVNPRVNAIVALQDRTGLLLQARERDEQLARGESMGPLHGLPHAVKDLQPVKGIRMTMGSPIYRHFVPPSDGLMVQRLRAAGALFIGMTNTPEFGLGSHTYNSVYGATRNAYDPSKSAGGSSGGAAVALTLRMLPLADGSDYGGSLRNPAGWNNVFGFRTSIGRIPNDARDDWLPSMGVTGPMARNVADLALLLSVQAGFDERVPLSLEGDGSEFLDPLHRDFKGARIAWGADFAGHTPCEPGVLEICARAMKIFESLGCIVEEALPTFDFDSLWQAAMTLRSWQQSTALLPHYNDDAKRALLKPEAVFEIETALRQSGAQVTAASLLRTDWSRVMHRFFSRYDFLVLPTAQVFPFAIERHWPREIAGHPMHTYHEWMKANLLVTMSGCPSLAVPGGFSASGLPIGLQIIAANRQDFDCLQIALAYEDAAASLTQRLPALITA